jgi:opacity protein-like surface antigen
MKKFTISVVTALAMSAFAMAGGDIEPVVEPVAEVVAPVADESGFYVGIAYGAADVSEEYDDGDWMGEYTEEYDTIMLQAGYKINKNLAVEGRYWNSFGDGDWKYEYDSKTDSGSPSDMDFTAWGIYVKPMYPVTEEFDVYVLLGYGNVTLSGSGGDWFDEDGFHWGLGASYEFTDNLSVFVDYVNLYDDDASGQNLDSIGTLEYTIYTVNVGVTYKF